MNDQMLDLKIERIDDEIGDGATLLEQHSDGNLDRVTIHPEREDQAERTAKWVSNSQFLRPRWDSIIAGRGMRWHSGAAPL